MKRVMLTVAYDGTGYCGFQFQPGKPTIEGELRNAVSALTGTETEIIGASRTDAGVHALGNVAVFDTESSIPPERFSFALNTKLPESIRITGSREVEADFHPRHCRSVKTYLYRIDNRFYADPLKRLTSMHFPRPVDITRMKKAAACLIGEHDFLSFANPSSQVLLNGGNAVRTLYEVRVEGEERGDLFITVRGNGFLYNMVRIIAGTLLDVGAGRFSPEDMQEILEKRDRTAAGMTAEAKGLTLVSIEYMEENHQG